jgi:hypothetical protein
MLAVRTSSLHFAVAAMLATAAISGASARRGQSTDDIDVASLSTTTMLQDWTVYATFGVFPREPLETLRVRVHFYDYNYDFDFFMDTTECDVLPTGASVTHDGVDFIFDFSNVPGGYSRSQNLLSCRWYSHDPAEAADTDWFYPDLASARNETGADVTTEFCMTDFDVNPSSAERRRGLCGDADSDGELVAGDALRILTTAVGNEGSCARCDVDRSNTLSATDALGVLQAAIGLAPSLLCFSDCAY